MLKKYIALVLALVLLLSVTACGGKDKEPDKGSTTTVTTTTTTEAITDGTTAAVTTDGTTTATADTTTGNKVTTTTKKPTTTTVYVPDGVTVPIGTRPSTTTTTTGKTTTVAGGTSADGTTTTAATTTTTTVAKPTDPPGPLQYVALPAVGTDIDVVKKRDRIRVSAAYAWFNEDGTIGVSLTFTNYTNNWITEETDYVQYTCYDKNGKVVQKATKIALGVIDTKKYKSKTFEFNVPADTAEVRLTNSKIVYWTEWS